MMEAMPSVDSLLGDLDDEQREAVVAPRGPVCVLAGAGTGKTRTITRRIANLVVGGHVAPGQVLAVTFTARAAGEMRSRLRALGDQAGVPTAAVQAVTFHAAARRQLQYFWPQAVALAPQLSIDDAAELFLQPEYERMLCLPVVLERCSLLVDGSRTGEPASPLPDGAVVDVLPPFAGG